MAKCGDCLYFGFCKKYIDPEETFPEIGGCHTFKSKDAFVEVVRCKDCKSKIHDKASNEDWCNNPGGLCCRLKDDYFCSYGERKDNERKAD